MKWLLALLAAWLWFRLLDATAREERAFRDARGTRAAPTGADGG